MAKYPCPVQGHHHNVVGVSSHRQANTGPFTADTFECPTGYYRWFVLRGQKLNDDLRQKRPRFGWAESWSPRRRQYTPGVEPQFSLIRTYMYDNGPGGDTLFEGSLETIEVAMKEALLPADIPEGALGVLFKIVFPVDGV